MARTPDRSIESRTRCSTAGSRRCCAAAGLLVACEIVPHRVGVAVGQRLYEWSAEELGESHLLGLVRDGSPIYAWPYEKRHVWRAQHMPFVAAVLERVTRAH